MKIQLPKLYVELTESIETFWFSLTISLSSFACHIFNLIPGAQYLLANGFLFALGAIMMMVGVVFFKRLLIKSEDGLDEESINELVKTNNSFLIRLYGKLFM